MAGGFCSHVFSLLKTQRVRSNPYIYYLVSLFLLFLLIILIIYTYIHIDTYIRTKIFTPYTTWHSQREHENIENFYDFSQSIQRLNPVPDVFSCSRKFSISCPLASRTS